MRIAIGADHAGFELKEQLKKELASAGYEVLDLGAHAFDALDDYPDFAFAVGSSISKGDADRGIVVCGSGVGACVAANKVSGVRASVATDTYSARQGVEHDDLNVIAVGARVTGIEVVRDIVKSFLGASFSGEERHVRRLNKVLEIEKGLGSVA